MSRSRLVVYLFLMVAFCCRAERASAQLFGQEKDTTELKLRMILPVVFYTPETKIGGGVAAFSYFKLKKVRKDTLSRISELRFLALYTQTKQLSFNASSDVYLMRDRLRINSSIAFFRLPYEFYGIGNQTPEEQMEEFTVQYPRLRLTGMWLVRRALYAGVGYLFERDKLVLVKENGLLSQGTIPGSSGGTLSGPGLLLTYDSRDHNYVPRKGLYMELNLYTFGKAFSSDYVYHTLELEGRKYFDLGNEQVLAFQGMYRTISGDAPFRRLSLLGSSSIMRGYYSGRYRDNNLLAAQAEYRFPVWRFLGGAVFAGAGDVALATKQFDLFEFKPTYGGGLRITVDKRNRLMARIDAAFGQNSHGFYFSVGQAF